MAPPSDIPPSLDGRLDLSDLTLEDLESIRLLLRGGSVIDWQRLDFSDHSDVDRFLRVNEFSPDSEEHMTRLEELRFDAVDYLARNFEFKISSTVAEEVSARDLFLIASRRGPDQIWACVVLKVMHIIHHLDGRSLATKLAIPDDQIYSAVERKVMQVVEELRASRYPITEFEWSRKQRDSLITKLLAKRSTLAANIYDKLRFRLVVATNDDIVPVLAALTRTLIPFNYVIPGESVNHLVAFQQLIDSHRRLANLAPDLQHDAGLEKRQEKKASSPVNEFSATGYKSINFIADLPVAVSKIQQGDVHDHGHVLFILTEFQILDRETTELNELGESSHDSYKARQKRSVRLRLMRGRRNRTRRATIDPP